MMSCPPSTSEKEQRSLTRKFNRDEGPKPIIELILLTVSEGSLSLRHIPSLGGKGGKG